MISWVFKDLWSRLAAVVVILVGALAAVARIRLGAQREMNERIQARTLENIRMAQEIENEVDGSDGDAIVERLRNEGWLRE